MQQFNFTITDVRRVSFLVEGVLRGLGLGGSVVPAQRTYFTGVIEIRVHLIIVLSAVFQFLCEAVDHLVLLDQLLPYFVLFWNSTNVRNFTPTFHV